MAFLLDDAVHGRGIGTLMLEQLAALAREHGIRRLRADTLAENAAMLKVFADSGFEQVRTLDSGLVELSLDTAYSARCPRPDGRTGRQGRGRVVASAPRHPGPSL